MKITNPNDLEEGEYYYIHYSSWNYYYITRNNRKGYIRVYNNSSNYSYNNQISCNFDINDRKYAIKLTDIKEKRWLDECAKLGRLAPKFPISTPIEIGLFPTY